MRQTRCLFLLLLLLCSLRSNADDLDTWLNGRGLADTLAERCQCKGSHLEMLSTPRNTDNRDAQ